MNPFAGFGTCDRQWFPVQMFTISAPGDTIPPIHGKPTAQGPGIRGRPLEAAPGFGCVLKIGRGEWLISGLN